MLTRTRNDGKINTSLPGLYFSIFGTLLLSTVASQSFAASARAPLVVIDQARSETVIKQVPLTGTVTSPKLARLSAQVSGRVRSVKVDIGDAVRKGGVVLQIDPEIEQLNLDAARSATRESREQLADAQRRYESAKRLRKQNNISIDELEQREAAVKIADAVLQRKIAEANRQQALVKRHTLLAPFSGVVSEKLTEAGEWVDPGMAVVTLVAINELKIDFQVPQEFYTNIDNQSRITVTLDALGNEEFKGKIEAIVPVSDPESRTFLMRVSLVESEVSMTPGMSVHGTLALSSGKTGVVVSRDALLRYPDGRVTVWTVKQDGNVATVSEQLVKVGHSFNGQVSIKEGLKAGSVVVVQGNESLQEGQTVRIHNP